MSSDRRVLLKQLGSLAALSALPERLPAASTPSESLRSPQGEPAAMPTIFTNQLGYQPARQKVASVLRDPHRAQPQTGSAGEVFTLRQGEQVVFTGTLSAPALDLASGDELAQADFSAYQTPGVYRLEVGGIYGDLFTIGGAVYADALRVSMRSYYGQRCGCAVDLGSGYKHPACHLVGAFASTSGKQGELKNAVGWHDAGDYGRYVVNSGITCGTLLWAWELFPEALRTLALAIPESGGKLPDYLAEVRWNLEWMLAMQDPADGGVWHKQTSLAFCGFIMPQDDKLPSEVIGLGHAPYKTTCASADLAAVMAIAARCYKPLDAAFADRCLAAARHAFAWATQNPAVPFKNPPSVTTGGYDDPHCSDERLWAAAELYRTTREADFRDTTLAAIAALPEEHPVGTPSWGDVTSLGLWAFALAAPEGEAANEAVATVRQKTVASAHALVELHRASGYGQTLSDKDYHWGSNSNAGNQSFLLLMANHFAADPAFAEAALGNLHYLLGRNCFGVSWVTQLGVRPFLHPHHRPSAADGIVAPWPGLLSGGPNATGGDAVADRLPPAPPMRMWLDDVAAYSLNEVAINWNAPLVFLLAAVNSSALG